MFTIGGNKYRLVASIHFNRGKVYIRHVLMDGHNLTQSDLPEVGSQGVISEIIRGKRELNVRQIRALAKRFKVSPSVFI